MKTMTNGEIVLTCALALSLGSNALQLRSINKELVLARMQAMTIPAHHAQFHAATNSVKPPSK